MKRIKGKIKGDPTPGYRTGNNGSLKLNSPYFKPKSVKPRSPKVRRVRVR